SASAAPLLSKLRELLDKAAGALKGLGLPAVLAPFLAALLAPLGLELRLLAVGARETSAAASAGAVGAGGAGGVADAAAAGGLTGAAAAALFAYMKPSSLPQAAKLVAALHKLLGPLARKQHPHPPQAAQQQQQGQQSAVQARLVPDLQRVLEELPPSLPYLCLCVKAIGYKAPQLSPSPSLSSQHTQPPQPPQPPQRDMATAWGHVAEHAVRLPQPQLAAWLAFMMLPPSPCPLDPRVTGAPLLPCPAPAEVRLTVLDACMPKLQPPAAAPPTDTAA
ncbi:hypothetical protein Agub_g5825, partial [Astrephomene gubernaculifera]